MVQLTKFKEVANYLRRVAKNWFCPSRKTEAVIVGFSQRYAIWVHENLENYHKVGQAKFLEEASREFGPEFPVLVGRALKGGATLIEALLIAGMRLQREAQKKTPVDTGALKASAFTGKEEDYKELAEAAFQVSEQVRKRELNRRAKAKQRAAEKKTKAANKSKKKKKE